MKLIRFLQFMLAMAWMYLTMRKYWMFSQRLAFFKELHPYFPPVEGVVQDRMGWPDGFLYVTLKDVRRARKALITNRKPSP